MVGDAVVGEEGVREGSQDASLRGACVQDDDGRLEVAEKPQVENDSNNVQILDSWNRKLWNNGRRGVRWTCWSVMLRSYQSGAGTNDGDDSRGGGVFK